MTARPDPLAIPTRMQRQVLSWPPIDGLAEIEIQTGVRGAALQASIAACKRRGWLDASGALTDAGEAALQRRRQPFYTLMGFST